MSAVLVSGDRPLVDDVAAALKRAGASVTCVYDLDALPSACSALDTESLDAYVQMPATFTMDGATAIARIQHFYSGGVLARFSALQTVLPALKPDARLVFVMGKLPKEVATRDDRTARESLVRLLFQAARADRPDGQLASVIQEAGTAAENVADVALGAREDGDPQQWLTGLDYDNWRAEVLGMVAAQT